MATIVKRGASYRAIIRKRGHKTRTKTFKTRAVAKRWIAQIEHAMELRKLPTHADVGVLLKKYYDEVFTKKPRPRAVLAHLRRWYTELTGTVLGEMDAEWWVKWATKQTCAPQSRMRYFSLITSGLSTAETLWNIEVPWSDIRRGKAVLLKMGLISKGKSRDQRVSDETLASVKGKIRSSIPVGDIADVSMITGLRLDEVCRLRRSLTDEKTKTTVVLDRKHPTEKWGNHQRVPLLGAAWDILQRQPVQHDPNNPDKADLFFPYKSESAGSAFRRAKKLAGLPNVRFHDSRHEATSRMFEQGFDVPEVTLVTGHRDWATLRKYTHLKPEHLHLGPAAVRRLKGES